MDVEGKIGNKSRFPEFLQAKNKILMGLPPLWSLTMALLWTCYGAHSTAKSLAELDTPTACLKVFDCGIFSRIVFQTLIRTLSKFCNRWKLNFRLPYIIRNSEITMNMLKVLFVSEVLPRTGKRKRYNLLQGPAPLVSFHDNIHFSLSSKHL